MISRLTAAATLFAVLATATLAYAVERPAAPISRTATRYDVAAPAGELRVIVLPSVEVIGRNMR